MMPTTVSLTEVGYAERLAQAWDRAIDGVDLTAAAGHLVQQGGGAGERDLAGPDGAHAQSGRPRPARCPRGGFGHRDRLLNAIGFGPRDQASRSSGHHLTEGHAGSQEQVLPEKATFMISFSHTMGGRYRRTAPP